MTNHWTRALFKSSDVQQAAKPGGSILTPLAVPAAGISIVALWVSRELQGWPQFLALTLPIACVAAIIWAYVYFATRAPDKLRPPQFELRREALALIEAKGGQVDVSPASLQEISNLDAPSIEEKVGGTTP